MMDISYQCGPQSADGQELWRVGGCQPTPLLYLMTAWFGGALDQTQSKESMRFVMRPIVGEKGQAHGSGATCGAECMSKGTLECSLWPGCPSATVMAIPAQQGPVDCALVFGCALRDTAALLPHAGGAQGWWELGASLQVTVTCST